MKTIVPKFLKKDFYTHTGWHLKKAFLKKVCKKRFWIYLVAILSWFYLVVLANAQDIETYISFPWMKYFWRNHSQTQLQMENIRFTGPSWEVTWVYLDAKAEKTIYYFHGNGGPLPFFYADLLYLRSLWYNVAALEYPGFNGTSGKPYEETLRLASSEFFTYLQKEKWVTVENTTVWGYSIGSGVALNWAKYKNIDWLILSAPLPSRYDMSKKQFGFVMQKLFFLENSFDNIESIQTIKAPILIVHGNEDSVIPLADGKRVWQSSENEQKYFIELDGTGHNGILNEHDDIFKEYIQTFLTTWKLRSRYIYLDEYERKLERARKNSPNLDFQNDFSVTKYIDPSTPFTFSQYVPENLVLVTDTYIQSNKTAYMRKDAFDALKELSIAFHTHFWKNLSIVSGYRSYEYQMGIKQKWCPDHLCANPWHSEHQSGLAVDLFEASTQKEFLSNTQYALYFDWLSQNAHTFGFTNSYQKGPAVDGYSIEPWHWRYVGKDFATYLKENELTFGEFYKNIKKQ